MVPRIVVTAVAIVALLAAGSTNALGGQGGTGSSATANAAAGVVVVTTKLAYGGGETAATGIVLSSSGQVLTNNHVIRGASAVRVADPSSSRTYTATVAGYSVSKDVALLELRNADGMQTAALGSSATIKVGDRVTAVGNGGGSGLRTKSGKVTGLGKSITIGEGGGGVTRLTGLIRTNLPLRPGDSGGPLLRDGRVIGMAAAASGDLRFGDSRGEGFAIPISTAVRIAKQIETGKRSATVHVGPTPFLGVALRPRRDFGQGAVVVAVVPRSPADKARIGVGDVITSFAGRRVVSVASLRQLVLRFAPGRKVRITWIDSDSGRRSAMVRLVSGPPQ
jgi:S1-C subfamily serine protease